MELQIKKLTPDMADEYLNYFEQVAFSEDDEWALCYCLESHLSKEENENLKGRDNRRNKAKELIESGKLNGYLVYQEGKPCAWCNAGDKMSYETIMNNSAFATQPLVSGKIMCIYCIDVGPKFRGQHISDYIMEHILKDALAQGYEYVEGYPFTDLKFAYQFHGPYHLYEKHGFTCIKTCDWFSVMQKKLSNKM